MTFTPFSRKQLRVLTWWVPGSSDREKSGVICDGAVRSGKTLCLSLSFIGWAMASFEDTSFALCGKTISSLERNLLHPLLPVLNELGFETRYLPSRRTLMVGHRGRENRFYLFGGRDEGSAALIQGVTLGGVLLDEVALMPRSFVEQALARCSLAGAKYWFSCNPEHPFHWFYEEWIQKASLKNMLYLHFTMADNPSLTEAVRRRYESLYSGAFYDRFVLGLWSQPSGAVYPMFSAAEHTVAVLPSDLTNWYCSCDYGTVNPCSIGLWGMSPTDGKWYRAAEYYHDSRAKGFQKTDEEYCEALIALIGDRKLQGIVIDPSAASFMECVKRHGIGPVLPGVNEVLDGIRLVSEALRQKKILFSAACRDTLREFSLYRWEENAREDKPRKENDHAMDEIRYFVSTVLSLNQSSFSVGSVSRRSPGGGSLIERRNP